VRGRFGFEAATPGGAAIEHGARGEPPLISAILAAGANG